MDMDMRKYIAERLDSMGSLTEKDVLRDVMEEIFIPMCEHMDAQYSRLEGRVREQMPLTANTYVTWGTLMERKNADGGCPYMLPMIPEDLQPPEIVLSDINGHLKNEHEVRIDSVFVEADYLVCKEIAGSSQIFDGVLHTNDGDIQIGVRLRPSKRYRTCIENLYRLFITNGIPWQTVNFPYMYKMFDVMLTRVNIFDKEIAGTASGCDVDFGKYMDCIKQGLVPVWNIQKINMKGDGFPLAAVDKVNYEYVMDLRKEGAEHGYLADYENASISNVRRQQDKLIVTSSIKEGTH